MTSMKAEGVALVTGASRGIGRATALELASRGFEVVATMRRPEAGDDLRAEAARRGGRLRCLRLDVEDPASIHIPSGLRVLVNNAGIEGENLPVEHAPVAEWRRIFETNVFGLIEVTRRAIPELRASGGGVICNITSCSTLVPMPFFAVYRASKAAVSALGESLRSELAAFGIRIVEIMPGAIETDMLAASSHLPEAARFDEYRPQAEKVREGRAASAALTTPAETAARAIADAILSSEVPLRNACDPMGEGLLTAWRATSDEEMMQSMLAAFTPLEGKGSESDGS
jgi:NAD(P)-dependent dehydrogenase (short-subunit alcohol dehydrogenase family)